MTDDIRLYIEKKARYTAIGNTYRQYDTNAAIAEITKRALAYYKENWQVISPDTAVALAETDIIVADDHYGEAYYSMDVVSGAKTLII